MSATVVFRSAARRGLRRATTLGRRTTLVANNKQQLFSPMEIITPTPRRHYSAGSVNMEEGLDSRPAKRVVPKEILDFVKRKKEEQAARHVFLTVDEYERVLDTRNLLMRRLVEDKLKYERLKRVLVRVPFLIGIAFCVKKCFSDGGEKIVAKNNMTQSD